MIFQDGDVYGRTVNVASRIADVAGPGEVLTTEDTARQAEGVDVSWSRVGPVELQGLDEPVMLLSAQPHTGDDGR